MGTASSQDDVWNRKAPDPLFAFAVERVAGRSDLARVEKELVKKGASADEAREILDRACASVEASRRQAGVYQMLVGGLVALAGIGVTIWSYTRADSQGGRYGIAWGAIVVGIVGFFRGLSAYRERRPTPLRRDGESTARK